MKPRPSTTTMKSSRTARRARRRHPRRGQPPRRRCRARHPLPRPAARKAAPPLPDKAQAILRALPALVRGETVELRVAAEALRDAGLLSKSGSSTKLFGLFPDLFELQPPKAPNHVRVLPTARA